jgi:hypothetical protein
VLNVSPSLLLVHKKKYLAASIDVIPARESAMNLYPFVLLLENFPFVRNPAMDMNPCPSSIEIADILKSS